MEDIKEKIQKLRKEASAGIMDCKKALDEANGDIEEALKILRKRGIAKADSKAGRETNQGYVAAYVHYTGKLGVLIEVLCETDFVARNEDFKAFANELAIHIAAVEPKYVKREDIPQNILDTEKEIFKDQIKDKPANVVEKIIEGKIDKFCKDICLLDQIYYKSDNQKIADFVKENIAKFGENIQISRFTVYEIR